jgi:hypothetical protein
METNDSASDDIVDQLFSISGNEQRVPQPETFFFVAACLHHNEERVRERAIFIGGLRWMDKTILGYFVAALLGHLEPSQENQRLMIESLVSSSIENDFMRVALPNILESVLSASDPQSLTARVAYVGIERLKGRISKKQFASIDYDSVAILGDRSESQGS